MSTAPALAAISLLTELLVSDQVYFRLAAQVEHLADCELAHMPGLTDVPAGCVVQAVQFGGTRQGAESWIDDIEKRVRAAGAPLCRIYLTQSPGALVSALAARGYRSRVETAFSSRPHEVGLQSAVKLHPVSTVEHWAERYRMHVDDRENSDGYTVDPAAWCQLVRAKCATGIKESFLVESQGQFCGSIAVIQMRNSIRFKNPLIRPAFRRQRMGLEVIRKLAQLTEQRGVGTLGAFGIEGEAGAKLYRAAGFSVVGSQTEWCRQLSPPHQQAIRTFP